MSFKVQPGHRVGVVGRTGAGKTTLCMALTRIVELEEGAIEIDGVDIGALDLTALRAQITMIPQDPTLFTGTLRYNLDPMEQHSEARIVQLIEKAGLQYLLEGTSRLEAVNKKVNGELTSGLKQSADGKEGQGKGLSFKV